MTDNEWLAAGGFKFYGDQRLLPNDESMKIAMDAALTTVANVNIPDLFATFVHPLAIEIRTAPLTSHQIFPEFKAANWADKQSTFRIEEYVGEATEYTDFGRGTTSDVNNEFEIRDVVRYQTLVKCGELEQEMAGLAKINLLASKQKAAAKTLNVLENKVNFFGVEGRKVYGLLTDPNLPSATTPDTAAAGGQSWDKKTPTEIYNDILKLFNAISGASQGLITFDSKMKLLIPPAIYGYLAKVTDFGIAPTMSVLKNYFPNLEFVSVPELDKNGVAEAMLIATEVEGMPTAQFGMVEKVRAGKTIQDLSSVSQKWSSAQSGLFLYYPFAIARMTGIQPA